MKIPEKLVIPHDEFYGEYVGVTAKGQQFFITTPFIPRLPDQEGREFVALYVFNKDGDLIEAKIDDLGTRSDHLGADAHRDPPGNVATPNAITQKIISDHLESLGNVTFQDITVKPFELQRYNTQFGLIPQPPEDEEDDFFYIILEPGDYMAFSDPWDGDYDT